MEFIAVFFATVLYSSDAFENYSSGPDVGYPTPLPQGELPRDSGGYGSQQTGEPTLGSEPPYPSTGGHYPSSSSPQGPGGYSPNAAASETKTRPNSYYRPPNAPRPPPSSYETPQPQKGWRLPLDRDKSGPWTPWKQDWGRGEGDSNAFYAQSQPPGPPPAYPTPAPSGPRWWTTTATYTETYDLYQPNHTPRPRLYQPAPQMLTLEPYSGVAPPPIQNRFNNTPYSPSNEQRSGSPDTGSRISGQYPGLPPGDVSYGDGNGVNRQPSPGQPIYPNQSTQPQNGYLEGSSDSPPGSPSYPSQNNQQPEKREGSPEYEYRPFNPHPSQTLPPRDNNYGNGEGSRQPSPGQSNYSYENNQFTNLRGSNSNYGSRTSEPDRSELFPQGNGNDRGDSSGSHLTRQPDIPNQSGRPLIGPSPSRSPSWSETDSSPGTPYINSNRPYGQSESFQPHEQIGPETPPYPPYQPPPSRFSWSSWGQEEYTVSPEYYRKYEYSPPPADSPPPAAATPSPNPPNSGASPYGQSLRSTTPGYVDLPDLPVTMPGPIDSYESSYGDNYDNFQTTEAPGWQYQSTRAIQNPLFEGDRDPWPMELLFGTGESPPYEPRAPGYTSTSPSVPSNGNYFPQSLTNNNFPPSQANNIPLPPSQGYNNNYPPSENFNGNYNGSPLNYNSINNRNKVIQSQNNYVGRPSSLPPLSAPRDVYTTVDFSGDGVIQNPFNSRRERCEHEHFEERRPTSGFDSNGPPFGNGYTATYSASGPPFESQGGYRRRLSEPIAPGFTDVTPPVFHSSLSPGNIDYEYEDPFPLSTSSNDNSNSQTEHEIRDSSNKERPLRSRSNSETQNFPPSATPPEEGSLHSQRRRHQRHDRANAAVQGYYQAVPPPSPNDFPVPFNTGPHAVPPTEPETQSNGPSFCPSNETICFIDPNCWESRSSLAVVGLEPFLRRPRSNCVDCTGACLATLESANEREFCRTAILNEITGTCDLYATALPQGSPNLLCRPNTGKLRPLGGPGCDFSVATGTASTLEPRASLQETGPQPQLKGSNVVYGKPGTPNLYYRPFELQPVPVFGPLFKVVEQETGEGNPDESVLLPPSLPRPRPSPSILGSKTSVKASASPDSFSGPSGDFCQPATCPAIDGECFTVHGGWDIRGLTPFERYVETNCSACSDACLARQVPPYVCRTAMAKSDEQMCELYVESVEPASPFVACTPSANLHLIRLRKTAACGGRWHAVLQKRNDVLRQSRSGRRDSLEAVTLPPASAEADLLPPEPSTTPATTDSVRPLPRKLRGRLEASPNESLRPAHKRVYVVARSSPTTPTTPQPTTSFTEAETTTAPSESSVRAPKLIFPPPGSPASDAALQIVRLRSVRRKDSSRELQVLEEERDVPPLPRPSAVLQMAVAPKPEPGDVGGKLLAIFSRLFQGDPAQAQAASTRAETLVVRKACLAARGKNGEKLCPFGLHLSEKTGTAELCFRPLDCPPTTGTPLTVPALLKT